MVTFSNKEKIIKQFQQNQRPNCLDFYHPTLNLPVSVEDNEKGLSL